MKKTMNNGEVIASIMHDVMAQEQMSEFVQRNIQASLDGNHCLICYGPVVPDPDRSGGYILQCTPHCVMTYLKHYQRER